MNERGPKPVVERRESPVPAPEDVGRETAESREDFAETVQEEEKDMVQDVRRGVAEWLDTSSKALRKLPTWVRVGILSTRLFATETALAQTSVAEVPMEEFLEERPPASLPELNYGEKRSIQFELEPYFEDETGERAGTSAISMVDSQSGISTFLSSEEMAAGVMVDSSVEYLSFRKNFDVAQMPKEGDEGWSVSVKDGEITAFAERTDHFGNHLQVLRSLDQATGACSEFITVEPALAFAKPGEDPVVRELMIELSVIGGRNINYTFYYQELPAVEWVDENEVYLSGMDEARARGILAEYGDDLSRGAEHVDALFGFHQPSKIVLRENPEPNAYYRDIGRVTVNSGLFEVGDLKKVSQEQIVEEVMEHEQFHYRDSQFGFSESESLILAFASVSPEELRELNESVFTGGYGGHAEENEKEFVASVLNSLDAPNWKKRVANLSPKARQAYGDALMAINLRIEEMVLEKEPPIGALLDEYLAHLQEGKGLAKGGANKQKLEQ